jgi:hypothetical protein
LGKPWGVEKLEWGGNGEGMGREWRGGCQFMSNLGPGWTRIIPREKEGFQVSKGDFGEKGISKGKLARGIDTGK